MKILGITSYTLLLLSFSITARAATPTVEILNPQLPSDDATERIKSCPNGTDTGGDDGLFRVQASGFLASQLPKQVFLSFSGSAVLSMSGTEGGTCPPADYGILTGAIYDSMAGKWYVNVAANNTPYSVVLRPRSDRKNKASNGQPCADSTGEGDETITMALEPGSGYTVGPAKTITLYNANSFKAIIANTTSATIQEGGMIPIEIIRACGSPLGVQCEFSILISRPGLPAFQPNQYAIIANGQEKGFGLLFPPGSAWSSPITMGALENSMTVFLLAREDSIAENPETVGLSTECGVSKSVGFTDNDVTTVTVAVTDGNAAEQGSDTGSFTISHNKDSALTVYFSFGGTATPGSDYTSTPASPVTIPASSSTLITVSPQNDAVIEGSESVILQIQPRPEYSIGNFPTPTVTITDNDVPTVSVTATDSNAAEGGANPGQFTVTRTGQYQGIPGPLTVPFTMAGTATSPSDYSLSAASSVTIAAGDYDETVSLTVQDDALLEGDETAIFQISANSAYASGVNNAQITIADNECYPVPPGLVGWWKGENNAFDQYTADYAFTNEITFAPGKVGQSIEFNGFNSWVMMPGASQGYAHLDVGAGDGFTIEAWVNPYDLSVRGPLVEWNNFGTGFETHLWILADGEAGLGAGNLYANIVSPESYMIVAAPGGTLAQNEFRHVAVTFDRLTGLTRLYRDGSIVAEQTFSGYSDIKTEYDLFFGSRVTGDGECYFSGRLDEISIFNRVLTLAEIQNIHKAGSNGKCL
jgi:hypothetical protein